MRGREDHGWSEIDPWGRDNDSIGKYLRLNPYEKTSVLTRNAGEERRGVLRYHEGGDQTTAHALLPGVCFPPGVGSHWDVTDSELA
eukprot:752012-Hanusia_phi.AAC.4